MKIIKSEMIQNLEKELKKGQLERIIENNLDENRNIWTTYNKNCVRNIASDSIS